jgi:hypothetical protein
VLAVADGQCGGADRWLEIGHNNGAGKLPGGVANDRGHVITIAKVQMPVVGAGDGELGDGLIQA